MRKKAIPNTPRAPTAASKNSSPTPPEGDSRCRLLWAAKRLFAAKGFDGATIKDLTEEAGVNASLVSYHFGGKEDLYRTCIRDFGTERVESAERILSPAKSKEDVTLRLRIFAEDFIDMHLRNVETCKIISRGMDTLDPVTSELLKSVFFRLFLALQGFLQGAKEAGYVRADANCEIIAQLLFGSLMHTLRSQDIARFLGKSTLDEPIYRSTFLDHWIDINSRGFFA